MRIFPKTITHRIQTISILKSASQMLSPERIRITIGIQQIVKIKTQERLMIIILVYHCSMSLSTILCSSPMEKDLKSQA